MIFLKIAARNLLRNPRRSLAIIITLAMGVGSLFLYHGFNTGIMNQYKANSIRSLYGHGQINTQGYREQVYEKPWEHWLDNVDDLRQKLKSIPEVKYVFPRIQFFALLTNGEINVSGRGQGIDAQEESKFFTELNIVEGKAIDREPDGIILGKGLARSLKVNPGDRVTVLANTVYGSLNALDLTVTGIFHTGSKEFDDAIFRIPIKQAQLLLDTPKVELISFGLINDDVFPKVEPQIKKLIPNVDATPFEVLDEIYYKHAIDFLKAQFEVIRLIILFVVILGIFNTVSTLIMDRKQEIGNLRANGESMNDVLKMLVLEGIIMGLIGGALGVIGTWLLNNTLLSHGIVMPPSPGITRQFAVFVELQPSYSLITILLGLVSAILATILAGLKVTRTKIGELLRSI